MQSLKGKDDLSPHGLWPAYLDARPYPQFCPLAEDPQLPKGRKMHEFLKHGSCSGLSSKAYFAEEEKVLNSGPNKTLRHLLREKSGKVVAVRDLIDVAGGAERIAIMSNKFCQLQEVITCWSKKPDGTAGVQIDCPPHVLKSGRNSGVTEHRCVSLALESQQKGDEADKCAFISKELVNVLKGRK